MCFSRPTGVSIALGMALNGAENETETQIASVLQLRDMTYAEINKFTTKLCSRIYPVWIRR